MTAMFTTDASTMQQAAARVDQVNADVQGEVSRLGQTIEQMAPAWAGGSKVAFDDLMVRWNDSSLKLREALDSIAENIRANASSFDEADLTNADAFQRIGGAGLLNL